MKSFLLIGLLFLIGCDVNQKIANATAERKIRHEMVWKDNCQRLGKCLNGVAQTYLERYHVPEEYLVCYITLKGIDSRTYSDGEDNLDYLVDVCELKGKR